MTWQALRVREAAREEAHRAAEERRLSFKQKEKRKRELGQAKGGKGNYVEEVLLYSSGFTGHAAQPCLTTGACRLWPRTWMFTEQVAGMSRC